MANYFVIRRDDDIDEIVVENFCKSEKEAEETRLPKLYRMDYEFFYVKEEKGEITKIYPIQKGIEHSHLLATVQEYQFLQSERILFQKYITAECLVPYARDLVSVDRRASLTEIKDKLLAEDVSSVAIVEGNKCYGLIKRKDIWAYEKRNYGKKYTKNDVMTPLESVRIVEPDTPLEQVVNDIYEVTVVLLKKDGILKYALSPKCLAKAFKEITDIYVNIYKLENTIKRLIFSLNLKRKQIIEFIKEKENPNFFCEDNNFIYQSLTQNQLILLLDHHWDQIEAVKHLNREYLLAEMRKAKRFRNDVMHFRKLDQIPEMLERTENIIRLINLGAK